MEKVFWDRQNGQFSVHLEANYSAIVKYTQTENILHITSTRVPDELQGRGFGTVMMEAVLPLIEQEGYQIVPICSYVIHYLNRAPQWAHLVVEKE